MKKIVCRECYNINEIEKKNLNKPLLTGDDACKSVTPTCILLKRLVHLQQIKTDIM